MRSTIVENFRTVRPRQNITVDAYSDMPTSDCEPDYSIELDKSNWLMVMPKPVGCPGLSSNVLVTRNYSEWYLIDPSNLAYVYTYNSPDTADIYSRPLFRVDNVTIEPHLVHPSYIQAPLTNDIYWADYTDIFATIFDNRGFIAGSWAAAALLPEEFGHQLHDNEGRQIDTQIINMPKVTPSDMDVFFVGDNDRQIERRIESCIEDLQGHGYTKTYENPICIMLSRNDEGSDKVWPTIQIVKPREIRNGFTYGSPEQVVDSFDFSVIRAFIIGVGNRPMDWYCYVDRNFYIDNAFRHLRFMNSHCPVGSQRRLQKYIKKGYKADLWNLSVPLMYAKSTGEERFWMLIGMFERINNIRDEIIHYAEGQLEIEDMHNALTRIEINEMYFQILVD